jgi:hypothetical protein
MVFKHTSLYSKTFTYNKLIHGTERLHELIDLVYIYLIAVSYFKEKGNGICHLLQREC